MSIYILNDNYHLRILISSARFDPRALSESSSRSVLTYLFPTDSVLFFHKKRINHRINEVE
jgi:hypothetical protein